MAESSSSSLPIPGKEALSKLYSQLTCAVCLNRYTDPRTLSCHHSYCKDCISHFPVELEDGRHVVKCPSCRLATQLSEGGSSVLPAAFLINSLLEIEETLKNAPKSGLVQLCPTHGNKPMDFYCETCEEHICFKCSTESHREHQCDYAEDLFTKHKEQIKSCLLPLQQQITNVEETLLSFEIREMEIRKQGKAVQKMIEETYQQFINKLQGSRRKVSQEADTALQEKLQLHSTQRANVESYLMQLRSCQELVEEELSSRSLYQIQAAKRKLVMRINDTHSNVKVSELQPAQKPNTVFTANKNTLSACGDIGDISCKQSFSWPDLFSFDLPAHVFVDEQVQVLITTSISLADTRLCCQLTSSQNSAAKPPVECPVTNVGEGQFKVMIQSNTAGVHQLRVLVDGVNIYGSPFTIRVAEWKRQNLVSFAKGLNGPVDVVVTDDGQHVLVAECGGHRVTVLSSTGKVVKKFGGRGSEPGKFKKPWSIAISTDGKIIVVDDNCLQKFTFAPSHIASCNTGGVGVAVHPASGKLFCTNHRERKIIVLNPDLTPSHSFGNAFLIYPFYLAIDTKGMVYVSDYKSGVILKFTPEGEHLATIGGKGKLPHQFGSPRNICIDSNDIMYVTDIDKPQVMAFTTEGVFLGSFGCEGKPKFNPVGVAMDNTGNMYVCDYNSGEVLVSRSL